MQNTRTVTCSKHGRIMRPNTILAKNLNNIPSWYCPVCGECVVSEIPLFVYEKHDRSKVEYADVFAKNLKE